MKTNSQEAIQLFMKSKFSTINFTYSQLTTLKDRIEELETRIKSNQEFERRIERIESRLGINEMMRLVERNRELEEKIKEGVEIGQSSLNKAYTSRLELAFTDCNLLLKRLEAK